MREKGSVYSTISIVAMFTTLGMSFSIAATVASRRTSVSAPRRGVAGSALLSQPASASCNAARHRNEFAFLTALIVNSTDGFWVRSISGA